MILCKSNALFLGRICIQILNEAPVETGFKWKTNSKIKIDLIVLVV